MSIFIFLNIIKEEQIFLFRDTFNKIKLTTPGPAVYIDIAPKATVMNTFYEPKQIMNTAAAAAAAAGL